MGKKIELNESHIVTEYLGGKSSLVLSKELNVSKPTILKILKKHNVTKKRDRCKSLDIKKEGEKYIILRKCPKCGVDVVVSSNNPTITCRNYYRTINEKNKCVKCMSKSFIGEGNHFYGKKHTKESLEKITKTLTKYPRKFSSSSKPEKIIEDIIKNLDIDVKRTYRINEYVCDIFIPQLNLIIEYNGDYWHCNPKKYVPEYFHPHKKKTSQQIWDEDNLRIDNIIKYGYNLEVVWESDFNKKTTIQNIIKKYERKN
jgi:G:T-mismatch repair DNA endonuclease (very short patch repair protein)